MEIQNIKITDLTPYEKNTRRHKKLDIDNIAKSIEKYGFNDPIGVWGDKNIIVEGHGRLLAAQQIGMDEIPCIRLDNLTDAQRREYAIAHNATAELSEWDDDILSDELKDIDLSDFDFNFDLPYKAEEIIEDTLPSVDECTPICKLGDIWKLGRHRLMCGDSTLGEDWERLMGGHEAVLVVTDPPYNMGYEGAGGTSAAKRKANKITNDKLSDEAFSDFLLKSYANICSNLADGGSFYVFYKEDGTGIFIKNLANAGLTFKQELIWVKSQLVLGGAKYQNIYEPFLFGCKGRGVKWWYADRKEKSVIESTEYMLGEELVEAIRELQSTLECDVVREKKNSVNDLHPTMKPLRLLGRLIGNSSLPGDVVVDCFGGSGSTMMACEQLGRKCYMIEYEPRYCDVIIKRYENLTGEKAVNL